MPPANADANNSLDDRLTALLGELLEEERQRIIRADRVRRGARRDGLRGRIEDREAELEDENVLGRRFDRYIAGLPETERPQSPAQAVWAFKKWESQLRTEMAGWQSELDELENRPLDKKLLFGRARTRTGRLLTHVAHAADLLPGSDDKAALVALYNATDGDSWTNRANWLSSAPLVEWYGVTADVEGNVTRLQLGNNNLNGVIPAELGKLHNLTGLHLESNELAGEIPSDLGNLINLKQLVLFSNKLTGEIPAELGNLASLEWIFLLGNALTGTIPASLGSISSLKWLFLNDNELTGEIPVSLGNLTNLELLALDANRLTGRIPAELGNLTNLIGLLLNANRLIGEIPPVLSNLVNLKQLYLAGNQLTGCIPLALSKVPESDLDELSLPLCDA